MTGYRPGGNVSIHAPAGGATGAGLCESVNHGAFQSTLPRGERPRDRVANPLSPRFQSTLPRGERLADRNGCSPPSVGFNPRSRGGSDDAAPGSEQVPAMFQSTLPRGERPTAALIAKPTKKFQSTLPRGERPRAGARDRRGATVSIHAPAGGATRGCLGRAQSPNTFQSTLPRGERPLTLTLITPFPSFNPRSRGGSDLTSPIGWRVVLDVSIHAPAGGATFLGFLAI